MASRNQAGNFPLNLQEVIENLRNGQDSTNWLESLIESTNESNAQILVQEIKGCLSRAITALDSSNQISNQLQLPPVRNEANSHTRVLCESPNDCYRWREYHLKAIRGFKYPRCDFVCIHKDDFNCGARKRVQRLEGYTSMYEIIYYGEHTCINSSFTNQDEMASSSSGFLSLQTSLNIEHGQDTFNFDELMEIINKKDPNGTNDD